MPDLISEPSPGEEELPTFKWLIPLLTNHTANNLYIALSQVQVHHDQVCALNFLHFLALLIILMKTLQGPAEYLNYSVHILALHYLAQDSKIYRHPLGAWWELMYRFKEGTFEQTVCEVIAGAATWVCDS